MRYLKSEQIIWNGCGHLAQAKSPFCKIFRELEPIEDSIRVALPPPPATLRCCYSVVTLYDTFCAFSCAIPSFGIIQRSMKVRQY